MIIRGSSGLGDSIYLYPVAKHYKDKGQDVKVTSNYPEIFRDLNIEVIRFRKGNGDMIVSSGSRRNFPTRQFEDVCVLAKIQGKIELKIPWKQRNGKLIRRATERMGNKRMMIVMASYMPFGRNDNFGEELMPNYKVMDMLIQACHNEFYIVLVGKGRQYHRFNGIDLDLSNKTSVSDLLDLVNISSVVVSQHGFMTPLCEALDKKLFSFFSRRGLKSQKSFLSKITPQKIIMKKSTAWVVDDEPIEQIKNKFKEHMK